ncbi:DUF3313 domain-containing protein [Enterobacter cloacae]|uniref:DUF3313 domain-containing protein n=1 Tax=Enterobacter cloacae TaxID=550 RepID=UPI0034A0D52E
MEKNSIWKMAVAVSMLALSGCASKVAQPGQYSGFLKNYADLRETTSASGKPELRWIDPNYNSKNYDNIVFRPVVYYPIPKPNTEISQKVLDDIRNYTNEKLKVAIAERKPLATTPGSRSLIFRGAITAVDSSEEGLQFYDVLPVALVVAGTEMATGHRTMNTDLFFEGELIDAKTGKPVVKVVRKNAGKNLSNASQKLSLDTMKQVIDDMAIDAVRFEPDHR